MLARPSFLRIGNRFSFLRLREGRPGWECLSHFSLHSPLNSLGTPLPLTDANYNVAAIVTDAGYGVEGVFYTACGEPAVFPFGDAIADHLVDGTGAKSTFRRGTIRRTTKFMAGRIRRSLLSTFPPPAAASPRRSG